MGTSAWTPHCWALGGGCRERKRKHVESKTLDPELGSQWQGCGESREGNLISREYPEGSSKNCVTSILQSCCCTAHIIMGMVTALTVADKALHNWPSTPPYPYLGMLFPLVFADSLLLLSGHFLSPFLNSLVNIGCRLPAPQNFSVYLPRFIAFLRALTT